jgi:hypothetical protein|uniref:Uncharacterized protein n=1 Tax=Globisporangium ultimum (strain ATCC 200006 / CBS 805.95 / DAOM BR144) TaxID=431595 RepID=K3WPE2_GLOUD
MFGTWDLVRPRYWHPVASLEQSMMDLDRMADRMLFPSLGAPMFSHLSADEDDDFFNDLPVKSRDEQQKANAEQASTPTEGHANINTNTNANDSNSNSNQPHQAFSTYSYSTSSIVDDKGRRVVSTRRRYEDSTGRLKALHERQIEDKKLRTVWNRMSKDDEGQQDKICVNGTTDEFEQAWKATPFGEAQTQHEQRALKEKDEASDAKEMQQQNPAHAS